MKVLVVVPARQNSKGIISKNTMMCAGKPLVEWTLDLFSSLDLPNFHAVVSTDCPKVMACAERKGVAVLKRPDYLATDDATTLGVLQHAVAESGYECDAVLCLQPTNPLRTVQDISAAYRIMAQRDYCTSVWSFVETSMREVHLLTPLDTDGKMIHRMPIQPRQEYEKLYKRTGEIYLTKRELIDAGSVGGDGNGWGYIIPRSRAWNIDEPHDIPIVEALLKFNGRV